MTFHVVFSSERPRTMAAQKGLGAVRVVSEHMFNKVMLAF